MKILAKDTMLLVIDFQEKLILAIYENEKIINNSKILIKGMKLLQIPYIITQQNTKGLGKTVQEIAEISGVETVFDKMTFSAYANEQIKNKICESGKKNIILCGTEAHICVLQTLIELCEAGYQVIIVEDCVGSRKKNDKDIAIKRAIQEGAFVATYESILFELIESADIKIFKELLQIVK